ncbi:MAG: HDOD domain-containing protein, partial [Desulfobacteraceae bacterium]|nr:HDOD domain-containing protein [Desulfobacteraceae bacterium]
MANFEHYHVAAGSFYVSRSKPLILQSFLGTCVGVALFDEEAKVGGLIHLLLPEPVSHAGGIQAEKYASTGFPLFLEAICNEGASKNHLKAIIAGGALVGPLKDSDLQLDIGGRTVETVLGYLKAEKIKVEKSETGGFFTCSMHLNMQNGQCSIEPAPMDKDSTAGEIHLATAAEIEQAMENIQPIPQVALKILRLIDNEEYEIKALAEEIRQDQVISARTIKLCNSVAFAGHSRVESLDQALVLLGIKLLAKLVISVSVNELFSHSGLGYSLCKGGLYHHAVGTAIISEKLADYTGSVEPGLAYTAGLLHDIGKVVLDQSIAAAYPLFYRRLVEEENIFSEAEKEILGLDHTQVGNKLARRWSFPESLCDIILNHHQPEKAARYLGLAHVVYLADLLMSRFHSGLELERLNTESLAARMETIGLSIDKFTDMVDLIPIG